MENSYSEKNSMPLVRKSKIPFVLGIIFTLVAVVLYFVGANGTMRNPLWIATTVLGILGLLLLAISAHASNGWTRMFSIVFMEVLIVIGTIMATTIAII